MLVPNVKINFSTLNIGGTGKLMYIPPTPKRASLKVGVACLMERILGTCS